MSTRYLSNLPAMIAASLVALCTVGIAPGAAAQTAEAVPDNATARRFAHVESSGNDWACDEHYRRVGASCEERPR